MMCFLNNVELTANGDWSTYTEQKLTRLGGMKRQHGNWIWPLTYAYNLLGVLYFKLRGGKLVDNSVCFG